MLFAINVPDAAASDLRLRLGLTRWPDEIGGGTWEYGTPLAVLKGVVEYWRDRFDWRKAERNLNGLPQFQIELEGRRVHYVHVMGVDADSVPLILTHGWPGSFVEMNRIIPMLTDPANNGLPGFRSFDVIAPSLPGFGFSYFAQGGNIGAGVSSWLASPPREWVERAFNVARWTQMPYGGHFAALEQLAALARDIHESFAAFR